MDIWAWVTAAEEQLHETEHARLADLLDALPSAVCGNDHTQVDAIYPEALSLARAAGNPWLEVFVRHWNLQSQILHRLNVGEWTGEAVSLLEFANREATKECPQSICVTQDLVNCYGSIDGPGYVEERLSAAQETLDRIGPKWPCFQCISSEYANALLDVGRADEALEFLNKQVTKMRVAGTYNAETAMLVDRIEALLAASQPEKALSLLEIEPKYLDANLIERRAILRARVLLALDRPDEADEILLDFERAWNTPSFYVRWAEAMSGLMVTGRHNDWSTDAQLYRMQRRLIEQGVRRGAIDIALWRAEHALTRGQPHIARDCATTVEALIPELKKPLDAPDKLAALHAKIPDLVEPTLPDDPEALLEGGSGDPEADLPDLLAASTQWPTHQGIIERTAEALVSLGRWTDAVERLHAQLDAHPDPMTFHRLANILLNNQRHAQLRTVSAEILAKIHTGPTAARVHWMLGHSFRETDPDQAREHFAQCITLDPPARNATTILAELERKAGLLEQALERLNGLAETSDESEPFDWDRMVVGTLLERFDVVRDSARRVGFKFGEETGPFDEEWGYCRIDFEDNQTLYAIRTGPVTARIVQINRLNEMTHFADQVLFEAAPKNDGPAEGEENHTWIYPAIQVLNSGGYTVHAIDGVCPEADDLAALRQAVEATGAVFEQRSDESYQLKNPKTEEALTGLYALIAVPKTLAPETLHQALLKATATLPPLTWLSLTELVDDVGAAKQQAKIFEMYSL